MWVIVFNAVDDFGIKEFNEAIRMSPATNLSANPTIESIKNKILDEALHGALRIAGLVTFIYPVCVVQSTDFDIAFIDRCSYFERVPGKPNSAPN